MKVLSDNNDIIFQKGIKNWHEARRQENGKGAKPTT
jgi:hypothetical protein